MSPEPLNPDANVLKIANDYIKSLTDNRDWTDINRTSRQMLTLSMTT